MALSGSFNTSGYYTSDAPYYIQFSWTATQNIQANTSTVTWTAKMKGGPSSGSHNSLFSRWSSVAGHVQGYGYPYDNNYPQDTVYNDSVVFSGSETITHNADGTGSFSAEIKACIQTSYPGLGYYNSTGSQTFTLDTIPRGLVRTKVSGSWKTGQAYVKVGGSWKLGQVFTKVNGSWKNGI